MTHADVYSLHAGESPLLISVPHDGREVPDEMLSVMTRRARALPDTDWHVGRLYDFCKANGASLLAARYSRYVVDLNRSADDEALYAGKPSTGLCPTETFAGDAIYEDGQAPGARDRDARIVRYWLPYHAALAAELERIRARHGYALLWDAHSIASVVPRLFEGELPELNLGTNSGQSCPLQVAEAVERVARQSPYSTVSNGRFRGGYITRHYGQPEAACYAIQMELSQRCYMDESSLRYHPKRAAALGETLRRLLHTFVETAAAISRSDA